jgi:hypothetical protein
MVACVWDTGRIALLDQLSRLMALTICVSYVDVFG